jgi:GTPase SAR1 family protein
MEQFVNVKNMKLLLLGDKQCGKTSLIKKLKSDEYDINYYESTRTLKI